MNYEDRDSLGIYKSQSSEGSRPAVMGLDTLHGNEVYNHRNESLGNIKEIMLDMKSGTVTYAVLSYGGFLGMGEKLYAVPWNALKLDGQNKRWVLNIDKAKVESAPGFDKHHWPDMTSQAWVSQIHTFYGFQPLTSSEQIVGQNVTKQY